MTIRRTVTTTVVALALVAGGGAAWAADDDPADGPGMGGRNGGWAGEDCPAGLDPDERAERQAERAAAREAFRAEGRELMGAWSDDARAARDAWREQRAALVDQIAAAETEDERAELLAQLDAAREAFRARMTELRAEHMGDLGELRQERRSGRADSRATWS